ncbi:cytochrome P450 [Cucurbitaria berberidis CBS 394.84]|uniref:Cytochrome P450 n=1 Tax=Cucurbitaria berberidis CBS 394.84 TaxID=1168544 RepID=A0A9P4GF28_9PLEO|nr:cytochrome P450 [Cucurbitaria berberidis CBS 394.84]KAF1844197.1 cytochrome P450 [Cucurbitaria berberidis CBS 394.84]
MSIFIRLRKANIPWLQHFLILASALSILSETRIFLLLYAVLTFHLDTEALLAALQNPREPPLIPHPYLPFLGHVVGMFWHGAKYFAFISASTQHPIFTLQTLNKRTIVVIDPTLATAIQKKSPNLTFYGMILEVTRRLVDFDYPTMEIIKWNLDGEHGTHEGLMHESEKMVSGSLEPGPNLNSLSTTQLEQFTTLLNAFVPSGEAKGVEIGLMQFVKQIFTTANANTIYGPSNPFAVHPHLMHSFWDYEAGMIALMADIFPSITSWKSWRARKAMNNALQEFIEKEHYRQASPLIQKRVAINLKHGISPKMAGRSELILLFGILGNAVPTTFWLLANIFARPELLAAIRAETSKAIHANETVNVISVSVLKAHCPLLLSTYRETLRHIANLSSVRLVTGTHEINAPGHPPFLLEKGNMIQIASGVIHAAPSTWGSDAADFKPERWMAATRHAKSSDGNVNDKKTALPLPNSVPSAAFRAFGGGSVLCPGRHFAMTEILGFVALCVNMFDVADVQGGVLKLPEKDDGRIPLTVMKPAIDPQVMVRRREAAEDVQWRLEL